MEEIKYKKFKGWNGTIYWVRMSREEIEERRKLGLVIAIPTMSIFFTIVCCFAAGIF